MLKVEALLELVAIKAIINGVQTHPNLVEIVIYYYFLLNLFFLI